MNAGFEHQASQWGSRRQYRARARDDQRSCATGPTPRLLNPSLNLDGSVGRTTRLVVLNWFEELKEQVPLP